MTTFESGLEGQWRASADSSLGIILGVLWTLAIVVGIIAVVSAGYVLQAYLFTIAVFTVGIYGVFAVTHFVGQMVFASRNKNKWMITDEQVTSGFYVPTVTVVIPTYNEVPSLLKQCLESVAAQDYGNIVQVILSNDGGHEIAEEIFKEVSRGRENNWIYINNEHLGKRGAMYSGFGVATGEIIVCMDSDTVIDPDAISHLIGPFADGRVGCVTGNIGVLNRGDNLLTKLAHWRYWLAFNLERAAQSYLGVMTCVSGPLGAYRRTAIDQIKVPFVSQTFLRNRCTFGDDRHLTNLVLSLGLKSVFVPLAQGDTLSPARLDLWCKQQLRWSRSFFREFLFNLRYMHKHNVWLAFDLTYQAAFPFFLGTNVLIIIYYAFTKDPIYLFLWLSLLLFFGLIRGLFATISTKNSAFLMFTGYGLLYVIFLLPIKLYALATVWKTTWGTK